MPTATAFLRAWAAGDLGRAAALTDAPGAARTRLAEVSRNLPVTAVRLVPHPVGPDGGMPFTATLSLRGLAAWPRARPAGVGALT